MSVLRLTHDHIPLKYRCPNHGIVKIKHVYFCWFLRHVQTRISRKLLIWWCGNNSLIAQYITCFADIEFLILKWGLHNIVQIHNNVIWDWQYSTKHSPHSVECSDWIWKILCGILSVPRNIVMNLNNVMCMAKMQNICEGTSLTSENLLFVWENIVQHQLHLGASWGSLSVISCQHHSSMVNMLSNNAPPQSYS